jgi:hypothetical protein
MTAASALRTRQRTRRTDRRHDEKILPIHGWSDAWLSATQPGTRRVRTRRPSATPCL